MKKYYFTFGSSDTYPHQNGYIMIIAGEIKEAVQTFRNKYPDRTPHILNCASYYNEKEWSEVLDRGFYANESPFEILYANPAYKREMELFETLLSIYGLRCEVTEGNICIFDSNDTPYRDSDGNIMSFVSTVDALNSLDWMLEIDTPSNNVYFQEEERELE